MSNTVTIATTTLPEMGATIEWQNDNSVIIKKGWLVDVVVTLDDQNLLYAFIKAQRAKAGLPV